MSEKNLNFSPPATPPMDLSDTNSNNSNDFKVSENYSKIIKFLNHQIQISKLTSYKVLSNKQKSFKHSDFTCH